MAYKVDILVFDDYLVRKEDREITDELFCGLSGYVLEETGYANM